MREAADAGPAARRAAAHAPGRDASTRRSSAASASAAGRSSTSSSLGWLGDDVWLAHCVHLDDARGRALRRDRHRASRTARPPTRRLGAGIAPVADAAATPARRSGSASTAPPPTRPASWPASCARRCSCARLRGGPAGADRPRGARAGHDRAARAASAATTSSARWRPASSPTSRSGGSTTLGHAGIDDPVAALVLGAAPPLDMLLVERPRRGRGRRAAHGDERGDRARPARAERRLADARGAAST